MKKKVISLFAALVLLAVSVCPTVLADSIFSYGEAALSAEYTSANNYGRHIVETDNYVVVHAGNASKSYLFGSLIHIYEKPNSEHMDYKFVTTIMRDSTNASYDLPVREMWAYGDVLYVSWNNVKTTMGTTSGIRGTGNASTPLYAYDLSRIASVETPVAVSKDGIYQGHPYNRGGTSYLDEQAGLLYHTVYSGDATKGYAMQYYIYDVSGESIPTSTYKKLSGGSIDAVEIYVKDGYLYELLQNKNGLTSGGSDTQAFNNVRIYNIASLESDADINSGLVGTYVTTTAGDRVFNGVEVSGNTMFIATTGGLEVVDITDALAATPGTAVTLAKSETLHAGAAVRALAVHDSKLYVDIATGMAVYDMPYAEGSEPRVFEHEGGFRGFAFNDEENMIYALSGAEKGGTIPLNMNVLFDGLNVSAVSFEKNSAPIQTIEAGELTFKMNVKPSGSEDVNFKSYYMLYEGDRLASVSQQSWTATSGGDTLVTDTLAVSDASNSYVKVVLALDDENLTVLPMISEEGIAFEIDFGVVPAAEGASEEALSISDMDSYGAVTVAGQIASLKGKTVCLTAENTEAQANDRLSKLRYFDIVTLDEEGKYAISLMPSDSGAYSIKLSNVTGMGSLQGELTAPDAEVAAQDTIEIPGIESSLYVLLTNGQNVHKLNISMAFDSNVLSAGEQITTSDEFAVSDVAASGGSVSFVCTKQAAVTKEANEFCVIPIKVASDAATGDYTVELTVTAEDKYGTALEVTKTDAVVSVQADTPKYDALNDAIAALKLVKAPTAITVDNYLAEVPVVENARQKVDTAYTFSVRDSQLGVDLIENLASAEARLAELKPIFDKVDALNVLQSADVGEAIKADQETFGITDDAIAIYDGLTNKAEVDEKVASAELKTPSDVYNSFTEAVVLAGFKESGWQKTQTLLQLAQSATSLDMSAYNALNEAQKAEANRELAMRDYGSIAALESALATAVNNAKESSSSTPAQKGGSGSGGSSMIYMRPPEVSEIPGQIPGGAAPVAEEPEIKGFTDIAEYGWAKEAIEYLFDEGVISGKAEHIFAPSDNVKREEFAKMVALAFATPAAENDGRFTDVPEDAWYSEYVYSLVEAEIINGRDDGSFGTGDFVTREEIAVILARAAAFKEIEITKTAEVEPVDADTISEYAREAVDKMCSAGIISGFPDGTVRPKEPASRAQVAQLIYNILKLAQ